MTVYVIDDGSALKIGYTGSAPRTRLGELQTAASRPLSLRLTIPGDRQVERDLHALLAPHRIRGEWFDDCAEVRVAIVGVFRAAVIASLLQAARYTLASFEIAVAYLRRDEEDLAVAEIQRAAHRLHLVADRLARHLATTDSKEGQE